MLTKVPKRKARSLGLVLFGLLFLVPGLGIMVLGPLDTLRLHVVSAGWERVPAWLEEVEVAHVRGTDSTTYKVKARYHYTVGGQTYQGSRVGYETSSDSYRDDHTARAAQLRRYLNRGEPVLAWVNPADPQQVFLVRELRWKFMVLSLTLGLVFAGAGGAMVAFGAWPVPAVAPEETGGPIYSAERYAHRVWLLFGFFFLLLPLPALIEIPGRLSAGNYAILVALIFPLAGGSFVWLGLRSRRHWRHYGPLPVEMDPQPGQLGGDVGGRIRLRVPWRADNPYQITLQCLYSKVSGSGKNSSRSESLLWQQEQVPYVEPSGTGIELRFLFQPPADLPASEPAARSYHFWRLLLSDPAQPVPLERSYVLPVQRGTGRSRVVIPERHREQQAQEVKARSLAEAGAQIRVTQTGGGVRIHSPFGLHLGMKLMLLLGGILFSAAAAFLAFKARTEGGMLWFMAGMFSLFGYPLLLGSLFMVGRSLMVEARSGAVRSVRYWFGLPLWRRELALTPTAQLRLKTSAHTSQGMRHTEYLHLLAEDGGRTLRVAEDIAGREAAEAVREELVRLLSLR